MLKTKKEVQKLNPKSVFAIDPSTNALAWSYFEREKLQGYGKHSFVKHSTRNDRFRQIDKFVEDHFAYGSKKPELTVVEQTIWIQNPATSRELAYLGGYLMGKMYEFTNVIDVGPLTWKGWLGYKNVTRKEINEWVEQVGKTEANKKAAFERKDRVKRITKLKFPLELDDFDIWDAISIGWWASNEA